MCICIGRSGSQSPPVGSHLCLACGQQQYLRPTLEWVQIWQIFRQPGQNMSKTYCSPIPSLICSLILWLLWHFRYFPPLVLRGVSTFEFQRLSILSQMLAKLPIYTQSLPMCTVQCLWPAENVWCRRQRHWLATDMAQSLTWLFCGQFCEYQPNDQHMSISTAVCKFVCKLCQ